MKIFISIFFLGSFFVGQAQVVTNVFWVNNSTLPEKSTLYYQEDRPLTWDDFEGVPASGGTTAAITMSGFGYHTSMKTSNGKGQLNISVYSYFNKDKSWVKREHKNGYLLKHEQRHFDISYIAALIFMQKVKKAGLNQTNCTSKLRILYSEVCGIMNTMQTNYDAETQNGQNKAEQARWDKYLAELLREAKN